MQKMLAIAIKDLKLLFRDHGGFFFTFFYPILFALFFGLVFSTGGDGIQAIKIDAVDMDQTPQSQLFLKRLASAPELDLKIVDSLKARKDVLSGKRVAYILLEKGFGQARRNFFSGKTPQVELGIDPSKKAESGMLSGILMKYAVQEMQQTFSDSKLMKKNSEKALQSVINDKTLLPSEKATLTNLFKALNQLWDDSVLNASQKTERGFKEFEPLRIKEQKIAFEPAKQLNSFDFTFPQGIVWGLLACAISFAVSLVSERTHGTLFRIQAASVRKSTVLAGKALASFIVSVSMALALILIGVLWFGIHVHGWFMLIFTILVVSLAFVGIMVLFSVLGKTERAVSGMGWALILPMAMLGGGMIPLAFMPKWLQTVSVVSPVKWAILSIEGSLWRAFTWSQLVEPLTILLLFGLGSFLIGVKYFKWQ